MLKRKNIITLTLILLIVITIVAGIGCDRNEDKDYVSSLVERDCSSCVECKCPVSISGDVDLCSYYLRTKITIKNETDSSISMVKFAFACKNVYGEELTLYTCKYYKKPIEKGCCVKLEYHLDEEIRFIDVKVYNVYFKENAEQEWGCRSMEKHEIKKYAPIVYSMSL